MESTSSHGAGAALPVCVAALYRFARFADPAVRDFMIEKNPAAFDEMRVRLCEAIERSLWTPRSNSARFDLAVKQQNEVTQ